MFGSRQGFLGSADRITGSTKSKMAADGHLGMMALSKKSKPNNIDDCNFCNIADRNIIFSYPLRELGFLVL